MPLKYILAAVLLFSNAAHAGVEVDWGVLGGEAPAAKAPAYTQMAQAAQQAPTQAYAQQAALQPVVISSSQPAVKEKPAPAPRVEEDLFMGAKWSGRANAGFTAQSGNSDTEDLNLDAQTTAKWGKTYRAILKGEYNREKENNAETENNFQIEAIGDYFFRPKWFLEGNIKWEEDDIAGLNRRTNIGLGLGHQPFDSDKFSLKYVLSPTYVSEEYDNGDDNSSAAVRWTLDAEYKIWEDKVALFHNHEILAPTDEMSEYNLETETGARVPIHKGLIASAQVDHDIDKAAPEGSSENDTKYMLKLGYEWGG